MGDFGFDDPPTKTHNPFAHPRENIRSRWPGRRIGKCPSPRELRGNLYRNRVQPIIFALIGPAVLRRVEGNKSSSFLLIGYQIRPLKTLIKPRLILTFTIIALVIAGCSRKKSGFTHRLYHNTTSLYNWYFNANEIMRQTEDQLWANKKDDYLELLPIYVLPDEEMQKNLIPQMDAVIEKCGTLIDRHSMEIKKTEHNKWIDNAYLLIGIASYYKGLPSKTEEMATYVAKKYKAGDARHDAALWLARTYIDADRYGKANTVLSVISNGNSDDRPKDFPWKLETVYAYMYLKQERYVDAIPHLQDAAAMCTEDRMKARLTYILAQTLQLERRSAEAIATFAAVVDMKPDFEMEFYAKISQALAFDRKLDSQKIKQMLHDMIDDKRNTPYYDQIYYALADMALEEQDVELGVEYLQKSVASSVDNVAQKGKSYLRLADLYFEDRLYRPAKSYYDSATTSLPEDYPNYDRIMIKARSLDELVNNLEIVEHNDSLLALAGMDTKDLEKKILRMIADLEAEAERKKQEELAALERLQNRSSFPSAGGGASYSGKDWYFYNAAALGSGFQEFKRRWGDRKLEDNWRRSSKTTVLARLDSDNPSDSAATALAQGDEIKTLEEYMAELPLDDSSSTAMRYETAEALYSIGTIYKERLRDSDNATGSFSRVVNDFEDSPTALKSYYQLYRIYVDKEQSGGFVGTGLRDNSDYYKDIILADYPDSEYAKLILNPEYVTEHARQYEEEKQAYTATYRQYTRRQYSAVLVATNSVIEREPENNFLSKYYLLKALTIGESSQAEAFEAALREVISKFDGTPEAEKAAELLNGLNEAKSKLAREQKLAATEDSGTTEGPAEGFANRSEPRDTSSTRSAEPAATDMYVADDASDHFFALVYPKDTEQANEIRNLVADFNGKYFASDGLRMTNSFIDKDHQIMIIRSFSDKEAAMRYYNYFLGDTDILGPVNEHGFQSFVITTKNFTTLFRNKNPQVYQVFFESTYLP